MEYKSGLAIYIDILGTKNSSFKDLYNINKIFHKELIRLKDSQTFCQKFVTSFSDCAFIIYTMNENDRKDNTAFLFFIWDSLIDLTYTISTILVNGFMCRGGISYGELYFEENNNILFGPAINEASTLEKEAIMPRMIFNDNFGNELHKKEGIVIKDKFRKLIRKDVLDNRYYLNYLYAFSQFDYMDYDEGTFDEKIKFGDKEYSFNEFYNILSTNSIDAIEKNNNDHNIISKHKWQLRYLRQHNKERKK